MMCLNGMTEDNLREIEQRIEAALADDRSNGEHWASEVDDRNIYPSDLRALIAEVRRLSDELERILSALMTSKPIFDVDPTARGPVSLIEYEVHQK